jgi:hypothetical protein
MHAVLELEDVDRGPAPFVLGESVHGVHGRATI